MSNSQIFTAVKGVEHVSKTLKIFKDIGTSRSKQGLIMSSEDLTNDAIPATKGPLA
jgi:hypothetical protein